MDRSRPVFAWVMYDFASSAYVTTVATALLPAYFAAVVARDGLRIGATVVPAVSLWGYAVSLAAVLVFVLTPVMGAMADKGGLRKRFLILSCLAGSSGAVLAGLSGPGDILRALGCFVLAHVAYNAGIAFYDAFMPGIAAPSERDRLSSLGYAYGYAGGGLNLALSLALIQGHDFFGLSKSLAVQLAMAVAGCWWLGFSVISFRGLREPPGTSAARLSWFGLAADGLRGAWTAARQVMVHRNAFRFLVAYIFYNDGVQTVISMATIYGKEELGLSEGVLLLTLLCIQAVALGGAMLFAWLAKHLGAKRALMLSLVGWTAVAVYGRFIGNAWEYFGLGVAVGVVLGGSQALSRSIYSRLVPPDEPAVYFGFFSVLTKLSAILGPLVFAVVRQATGSSRPAVLALVIFFLVGLTLLTRVKIEGGHA
jgi:UMF1 family MFS transporter